MSKQQTKRRLAEKRARERLRFAREALTAAQDECERRRAEAQWVNGYRVGAYRSKPLSSPDAEHEKLYRKEQSWWKSYESAEETRSRAVLRLLRAQADMTRASITPKRKRTK